MGAREQGSGLLKGGGRQNLSRPPTVGGGTVTQSFSVAPPWGLQPSGGVGLPEK